ncbi:MAG: polysaccharide biosynthesis/export family protein [Erythrobacter sp.]|jgi:polysaccharide export outer membrane protein|nr:polysaccharide biosynthesis/export family protein [Erythrobacter sp.]
MKRFLSFLVAVLALPLFLTACGGGASSDLAYATPSEAPPYTLGPGDRMRITVYGEETLTGEYRVTGEGDVSFPLIGNVPAEGMTIEQLQRTLTTRLSEGYIADPRISAEIIDYRPYYVLGEVGRPGEYTYAVGLTLQQAVAAAGGFTYRANDDRVFLKRAGETKEMVVDLDEYPAFPIQPGDTIRIGERYF